MTMTRCVAALAVTVILTTAVDAQDSIQFNRDIRPIFMDTCLTCHGPDSAARKADLRMDKRDAAIEHGAISPGKPDESEMIRRILSEDPEEIMPPPELKKPLSPAQKKLLIDWVQSGAEYQQHWSYIAPVRAEIPAATADSAIMRHASRLTNWDRRNPSDSRRSGRLSASRSSVTFPLYCTECASSKITSDNRLSISGPTKRMSASAFS